MSDDRILGAASQKTVMFMFTTVRMWNIVREMVGMFTIESQAASRSIYVA
jgi:hypothetical protein